MQERDDFVTRLRIRWEAMGDMANDERTAAAAEIESLRHGQREMMRTIATLRSERDTARRTICAHVSSEQALVGLGQQTPEDIAQMRGWDCFKENTND